MQVKDIECLSLIKELIDNGIAYAGKTDRHVSVTFTKDDGGVPTLRVSDLGCGMSEVGVKDYFKEGHTTAGAGPTLVRGKYTFMSVVPSRQKDSALFLLIVSRSRNMLRPLCNDSLCHPGKDLFCLSAAEENDLYKQLRNNLDSPNSKGFRDL